MEDNSVIRLRRRKSTMFNFKVVSLYIVTQITLF